MLIWVGKSKKQKILPMESQNIAISKFGNLSIIDIEVIDDFEPLFGKDLNIECIIQTPKVCKNVWKTNWPNNYYKMKLLGP